MILNIDKDSADSDFIEELVDKIKRDLFILCDGLGVKISLWQDYINKNINLFSYSLDSINLQEVLDVAIDSICYKETEETFTVGINEKVHIKDVYVSVLDICKLVNYGNMTMGGIYIFSDEFERIDKNLDKLEEMYYSGRLI